MPIFIYSWPTAVGDDCIDFLLSRPASYRRRLRQYLATGIIFAGIIGLWLLLGSYQQGAGCARYFLLQSDQGVVSQGLFTRLNLNYLWYAYYSLQRRFFWLVAIGVAAAIGVFGILQLAQRFSRLVYLPAAIFLVTASSYFDSRTLTINI